MSLSILGLTTTAGRSFYRQQETALTGAGIDYTTLEVPNEHRAFDDEVRRRTALDYVRFLPTVLRHSLREYHLVHANYGLTAPFALAHTVGRTCFVKIHPTGGRIAERTYDRNYQSRVPVVVSLWGGEFVGNRFAPVIRTATKRADAVIVPSETMRKRLSNEVRPRATVIPFPVDTDLFYPIDQTKARERIGWETDHFIVLFPYAQSRFEKNYPLAERVISSFDENVELRTVANESYEKMSDYMNASDVLLITSRWESGPMTVKEALACNLPIVSRPVGFVPSLLEDIDGCYIEATERKLKQGLEAVLMRNDRVAGRRRVTEYSVDEMGEQLKTVYRQCLE